MKSKYIMWLICFSYFLSGLNLWYTPPQITKKLLEMADPGTTAQLNLFSIQFYGMFFMVVCVICFALTLVRRTHWAYGIMTFVITFWALLYLVSWAETGYWRSVYDASGYFLTTGLLLLCSDWTDPLFKKGGSKQ